MSEAGKEDKSFLIPPVYFRISIIHINIQNGEITIGKSVRILFFLYIKFVAIHEIFEHSTNLD
jgi:hypothetical protein